MMTPHELQEAFHAVFTGPPWCFCCEDRPSIGYLVLIYVASGRVVPRPTSSLLPRPSVCGVCRYETHGAEGAIDWRGRKTRWRFVAFSGRRPG